MNDAEFAQLMVLLDSLWGGVDEVLEVGYHLLLSEFPYEQCERAVSDLARGVGRDPDQLKWLPKPSEVYAHVHRLSEIQKMLARATENARRLAAPVAVADVEQTNPKPTSRR